MEYKYEVIIRKQFEGLTRSNNVHTIEKAHSFVRGLIIHPYTGDILSCGDETVKLWRPHSPDWEMPPSNDIDSIRSHNVFSNNDQYKTRLIPKKPEQYWSHSHPFTAITLSYDASNFATTCSQGVHLWDFDRSEPVAHLEWTGRPDNYMAVSFNHVERYILAATASDRSIVFYDTRVRSPIRRFLLSVRIGSISVVYSPYR